MEENAAPAPDLFGSPPGPPALVPLASLQRSAWNPRAIDRPELEALKRSILRDPSFMWRRPILAMADGEIYAGHQRHLALEELGAIAAPACVEDVDPVTARERAVRDNVSSGEFVEDRLRDVFQFVLAGGGDRDGLGFTAAALEDLLREMPEPEAPGEFRAYDETMTAAHLCPKCGYEWNGG